MPRPSTVVFDLGAVLIDWDPRYAYRAMGGTEAEIEHFLDHVATSEWNRQFDAGRPFADGIAERKRRFPEHAEWLDAWWSRWPDMLGGPIDGTVEILRELKAAGVPLLALTNWSAETFPIARQRFEFLSWFDGIVVSGEVGLAKPDVLIFEHLMDRFELDPGDAVFVDDSVPNVEAADALGFHAIHFTDPAALRRDLAAHGLL
ncbi:HAD family hydrolase [Rubrivirga sp. IMCC45206]|uniref:HAD family hydrolase n=1 Tax=Rubrivirga sp. IMCC45206 TaxID=3391614 RepID=UPI00398FC3A4